MDKGKKADPQLISRDGETDNRPHFQGWGNRP